MNTQNIKQDRETLVKSKEHLGNLTLLLPWSSPSQKRIVVARLVLSRVLGMTTHIILGTHAIPSFIVPQEAVYRKPSTVHRLCIIIQHRRQPAFCFLERHFFPAGIILYLILSYLSQAKIFAFRVTEIPA